MKIFTAISNLINIVDFVTNIISARLITEKTKKGQYLLMSMSFLLSVIAATVSTIQTNSIKKDVKQQNN